MENNKINNILKTISTSGRNCKIFSTLEIFGLLFVIISLILADVSFNRAPQLFNSFGDYFELILKSKLNYLRDSLENSVYATFVIGMIFVSIGFLGIFICSLILINHNNILVKYGQDSISGIAIVSIFLGILTGIALGNKVLKIVNEIKNSNQLEEKTIVNEPQQNVQSYKPLTIKDTKIDFSNEKHIDKLKEKLENIQKLKRDGFINDYEYTELKEKIISES